MNELQKRLREYGISAEKINKLFSSGDTISIPSKVESKLKYFTKKELKTIADNTIDAKDYILIILSNFSTTWSLSQSSNNERKKEGYKRLSSEILRFQVSSTPNNRYKKIINLLLKHQIIEKGSDYLVGKQCREYRLTKKYFGKGIVKYQLKSSDALRINSQRLSKELLKATSTTLGRNSLKMYSLVELPTIKEVEKILKDAMKNGYRSKKSNRKLVIKGKNYRDDDPRYVYFEDYIKMYKELTDTFIIPIVTGDNAGGRVIDSFNLMPSLIRKHIKINGERIVENDYSCLHPSIAMKIYGGSGQKITHDKVADYLSITRGKAKKEHLSFFNKNWKYLILSPLFKFYTENELEMMENIYKERKNSERGHKITSQQMFTEETKIMTEVVQKLENEGINVIYVFDALYSSQSNSQRVSEVMNQVAKEFKVNTSV